MAHFYVFLFLLKGTNVKLKLETNWTHFQNHAWLWLWVNIRNFVSFQSCNLLTDALNKRLQKFRWYFYYFLPKMTFLAYRILLEIKTFGHNTVTMTVYLWFECLENRYIWRLFQYIPSFQYPKGSCTCISQDLKVPCKTIFYSDSWM